MSLEDALAEAAAVESVKGPRTAPPGTTQVRWDKGKTLEIDALPVAPGQSAERALLQFLDEVMGADVTLVEALDLGRMAFTLQYNADGRQLAYVKCPVDRSKVRPPELRQAAAEFTEQITRLRPRKPRKPTKGATHDNAWFAQDWQLGKGREDFGGLASTLDRASWFIDEELPTVGRKARHTFIGVCGDLTEGCWGSYTNQPFVTSLNSAEQFKAAQGVLHRMIERALDVSDTVEVTAVASNHDQNSRGGGKDNVTDDWDDRSFMMLDNLAFAYGLNEERYHGRVTFTTPADPLVAGVKIRNTTFAMTHGHKVRGSGEAVVKMNNWWKKQIASRHGAAAAAQVLVAAHYHHFYTKRDQGRLLVGLPAADGGSKYLKDGNGTWSMPGFVTMKVDDIGVQTVSEHIWPGDRERAAERLGIYVP